MGPLKDGEILSLGEEDDDDDEWGKGFKRKDHWRKHLQDEHKLSRETVALLQTHVAMPPTATLKDHVWMAVLPPCISRTYKRPQNASEGPLKVEIPFEVPRHQSLLNSVVEFETIEFDEQTIVVDSR